MLTSPWSRQVMSASWTCTWLYKPPVVDNKHMQSHLPKFTLSFADTTTYLRTSTKLPAPLASEKSIVQSISQTLDDDRTGAGSSAILLPVKPYKVIRDVSRNEPHRSPYRLYVRSYFRSWHIKPQHTLLFGNFLGNNRYTYEKRLIRE